ncbi:MAG: PAS domain S-box protein, partial [Bacteroidota bacterium]
KTADGHIRIWVAGCSTGEEAYSIAICFKEYLGHKKEKVQIFATDLSEPAIIKARTGIYSKTDAEAVSPGRLKQNFTYTQGGYRVNKELRDMCVFAVHNFLNDPPFGKIDFISCRNVLIYMDTYLQKKALANFHYALNTKGLLMLGKSENTIGIADLFANNGKNEKIFTRKDLPSKMMHVMPAKLEPVLAKIKIHGKTEPVERNYQKKAEDLLLKDYMPAAVVVNDALDILSFFGDTDLYLKQFPGKPSHNLLKMAKMGLAFELRSILNKVRKEKKYYKKENILVKGKKLQQRISIEVKPLTHTIESYYLVLFSRQPAIKHLLTASKPSAKTKKDDYAILISQLEEELSQLREDMRTISEDQESSNEELQSANEELLSSNEELQSLNEEMETSKEELQSTVEELTVVNQEMVNLNDQLAIEKNYAEVILTTIPQPLLVLDKNLRVILANEIFYEKFGINKKATEGYLIYDLGNGQWNIPALRTLLENIIPEKQSFFGFEVDHYFEKIGHRIMLLNARELLREKDQKLILLVIEDITERVQAEKTRSMLASVVESSDDAIISKTLDGIITSWNKGAEKIFGYTPDEVAGKHISILIPPALHHEEAMVIDEIKKGNQVVHFETQRLAKDGRNINISLTVSPLKNKEGKIIGASKIARDITEQVNARKKIEESEDRFHTLADNMSQLAWMAGANGERYWYNQRWYDYTGTTFEEMKGFGWQQVQHPEHSSRVLKSIQHSWDKGEVWEETVPLRSKDGNYRWFLSRAIPISDEDGKILRWFGTNTDITDQKNGEQLLIESEKNFRQLADSLPPMVWQTDTNGKQTFASARWKDFTGIDPYNVDTFQQIVHPDDFEGIIKTWKKCLSTGNIYKYEVRLKSKNNVYHWFQVDGKPIYNEGGTIEKWVGAYTDINERKLAEEKLKESEERFRKLSDYSPMFVFLIEPDPEATVSYWNQPWLDYTGQTHDEALGRAWDGIIHPEDVHLVLFVYTAAFEKQKAYKIPPIRVKRHDGEYRWYSFQGNPRYLSSGEFNGYVGVGFDVHERLVAETALDKSEKQFSTLVENMENLAWLADGEGYIYWYNKRWYQYTGSTLEEMEGWGWQKVHHPDHVNRVVDFVKLAWHKNEPFELTFPLLGADGQYKWFLTRAY